MKRMSQGDAWEVEAEHEREVLVTVRYARCHGWEPDTSDYAGGYFDTREIVSVEVDGKAMEGEDLKKLRAFLDPYIRGYSHDDPEPEEQDHERI